MNMQIIDRKTGKRLINTGELKTASKEDPVKRNVEKNLEGGESSPMDPPDAYSRDHLPEGLNPDELSDFLKVLLGEHKEALVLINEFESALVQFRQNGYHFSREHHETFSRFFEFIDTRLMEHQAKEDKILFPILHQRLIDSGEHSKSNPPKTAIDVMEDDHVRFIQLGALAFNLLGLASRLGHEASKMQVFDIACNNARELVELLRLHFSGKTIPCFH